ncbi:hypothetical protein ABDD95_07580 [Mucilaginibacter sp. PAMB04274]|uniref:hypothetical protein n=1 Tax=Mucilaginibacter sp. PAMB04274 TaxID=3138568 RepID=UPI0031F6A4D3
MKKLLFLALITVVSAGSAIKAFATEIAAPTCDYTNCPSGSKKCCSEGGVTLYKDGAEDSIE